MKNKIANKLISDVKVVLNEYREINIDIEGLEYQIKTEDIRGVSYSDMPGSATPNNKSSVESSILKIEKLKKDKLALEIKKEAIDNILNRLSEFDHNLIRFIYIDKMKYKQVENKLNMSRSGIINNQKRIMCELYKNFIKFNLIHK